jgi:hypothetical protein
MSNDTINVQRGIVGAGSDDDTYVLSASLIDDNAQITITDVEGANKIQLIGGLTIASSIVAGDTAQLTLSNGAVITVLGASSMSYEVGGNPLTGTAGVTKDYATFATDTLGVNVPADGEANGEGGASTVNEDGTATVTPPAGAATYALTAGAASVNEGATATFALATTNVAEGTEVAYTITGVDAADVTGGSLTGTATVAADGTATISVALAADAATEGEETVTVTIDGQAATASSTVADTSTAVTFSLTADASTVNEGTTVNYTVADAEANTTYNYTISGVSAADLSGASLTGSFTTDSSGAATFSQALVEDLTTEGTETLTITVDTTSVTAGVTVTDSSTTPAGTSKALTTDRDIITALTSDDDVITGDFGTVQAEDIVLDSSTTDNDSATLTMASSVAVTLANIETVSLDMRESTTGTVDATNFSGVNTLNVDSNYGAAAFVVNELTSGVTVGFDSTATSITTDMYLAAGGTDSKTDAITVSLGGGVSATYSKGATEAADADVVTFHSTGSSKNTITLSDEDFVAADSTETDSLAVSGDQDITIISDNDTDAKFLDGATLTSTLASDKTLKIELTGTTDLVGAEIDLDSVDGIIELDLPVDTGDLTVIKHKSGATIQTGVADTFGGGAQFTNATAAGTVNFNFAFADNTSTENITFAESATVNVASTASAAINVADNILTTFAGIGNSTDLNVATGAGLTLGSIAAGGTSTLDAIVITGDTDFTATTIAANSLTASVEDYVSGDLLIQGATVITASKTVTLDQVDNTSANTGSLTVTAGGNISAADAIGQGAVATDLGNVSLTSTGGSVSVDEIDSDGTITLASGAGFNIALTQNIAAVGDITITSGKDIDMDNTVTTSGTLTLNGTGTTDSTIDGNLTVGTVIFDGASHTFASVTNNESITGNVTVQGGASLSMTAGTELITGTVTHTGSGTVSIQDLAGQYSGADATGAVDIDDTAAGASNITTGSGNDNIVLGDVATQVVANAGNDVIDASGVTTNTNQVNIDGGAGVDIITGGAGTTDILTGGTGTDTFRYTDDTHGSASETITDFVAGSAGDILAVDLSGIDSVEAGGLTSDFATVVAVDTTDSSTVAHDNTDVYVMTGKAFADADAMIAGMNDSTTGISGTVAANDLVLVVWADTDGHSYVTAVSDDGANSFANDDEVTIAQLTGLSFTDLASMTTDNFATI